ncbi:MBL fold metallo-hydrolase [soil metagenome]
MIEPAQRDDGLVADIAGAPDAGDRFHAWWLGQSGFLLKFDGHLLAFDPYLSDSLSAKYAGTDKPHVRMTGRCLDPARLRESGIPLAAITSSHNHTDHLDAETLRALAPADLVLPEANMAFARERLGSDCGLRFHGIAPGAPATTCGPFTIAAIPAAHNEVAQGFVGFAARFGDFTVYHSGDTLWHDALVPSLVPFAPIDLALVPINGNDPARRVAGNLNGTEAAALARAINARLAIPHHFDMFEFNTASPDEFVQACKRLGQPHRVLLCGERITFPQH